MSKLTQTVSKEAIDIIFLNARSFRTWQPRSVSEDDIRQLYELFKLGPTSLNSCPARFVWVLGDEAKRELADCALEGNVAKILSAPAIAIIGYDCKFYEKSDRLAPHAAAQIRSIYESDTSEANETAFRNSSLQGAYLIIAARACGLDCGPISGFDHEKVNRLYFKDTDIRVNFLCCIGYGQPADLRPRGARLPFDEANRFA